MAAEPPQKEDEPPPSFWTAFFAAIGVGGLAAGLALFSALVAIPAFIKAGVDTEAVTVRTSGTQVLSEPFIDPGIVRRRYRNAVPRAVDLAVRDFNRGTQVDLTNDTQDYQTRYSPDATCADAEQLVRGLYGPDGCDRGSQFYKLSTQYERGLLTLNGQGDPATGYRYALDVPELRKAMRILRAAETDIVACTVHSREKRPIDVTVSPSSGYRVQGEKTFTLAARGDRRVILTPEGGAAAAAIGEPGCTLAYDLAPQAKNARASRGWIIAAGLLAALSFLVGVIAKHRGIKVD
ncbi:MAG: hypothetical protein QOE60_2007 [Thermoleophilaceae bacterium]|nr:hypothetical protein [Thermoleophilaceae bacterium]